ncbi:tripartite tricarboxylate transporter substrate binding protein [Reyranella sp. CPCC 100927]|uniref:Bug family tripartite tricarboxylate transporter substrate binding protein n=1 Tax=Reyranella sp. CPCC 100927 TaxID=2599616 RepID=UPI0011B3A93E|nr:tripartite tricarboxylate transporter substrate binding protein [Reyranella sp. CPCC 100927]TWT02038.1 tripartite tricarboxylate transporter substrate binding protein [Reyranella sp. CPCC 100927]
MQRRHVLNLVTGIVATAASPSIGRAQGKYPDKPVRLVIPFPPAGPTDIIGRMVAEKLTPVLGQQIVVDNKAGAAGSIGSVEVARAKPDGYTLLFATSSTHAMNPTTFTKPPYDAVKDFAPVALICVNPLVLVTHPSMPDTLPGLIDLMKKNPGKYSYGSSGTGGITHFAGEMFKTMAGGLQVEHVPYRGSNPALQDTLAGNVAWMFETVSTTLQHHRTGKLRILGFAHAKRAAIAPDIPTIIEAGLPGYEAYTFNIVMAPTGTPQPVLDTLHAAYRKIMTDAALIKGLDDIAAVPYVDSTPALAAKFVTDEIAKWAPIIKATGTKIE